MSFQFDCSYIENEISYMNEMNKLTWKDVVEERLDKGLKSYQKDIDFLIKSLENKNPMTILKRLK